ncbi:Reduced growth phenotype protein 1 [Phaffia rhodozyma]|uniref:Reduced growth phenotype protein 1 n=1 Tax=Phaffia rhodozyma TaxID=264483 RepID=A0A0F7STW6_PHARH|nr:Reduced growth phenotype protein 1 [Phaffia rhodozyma]
MSFLPSFASSLTSSLKVAQEDSPPPKLLVTVTPLRPSVFAGELFQAKISLSCVPFTSASAVGTATPTGSTGIATASSSAVHLPQPNSPYIPPSPAIPPYTPKKPVHRAVQSLSTPANRSFREQVPPRTGDSPYAHLQSEVFSLEKYSSDDLPPRRGLVGRRRKSTDATSKQLKVLPSSSSSSLPSEIQPKGHCRRSSSGSELAGLVKELALEKQPDTDEPSTTAYSAEDPIQIGESPKTEDKKGKGRTNRLQFGRSQSVSTIPAMASLVSTAEESSTIQPSPLQTPPRTNTLRPTYTSPSTRNISAFPPSHPHARKPSHIPASLFQSPLSTTKPGGGSRSVSSASTSSNLSMPSILETEPSHQSEIESEDYTINPMDEMKGKGLALDLSTSTGSLDSPIQEESSSVSNSTAATDEDDAFSSPLRPPTSTRPSGAGHRSRPSYSSNLGLGVPSPQTPRASSLTRPPESALPPLSPSSSPSPSLPPSPSSTNGLKITWSYVHLVANLTPSPQYLPAESLLPLRHALLETSSVGSGMLPTPDSPKPGESSFTGSLSLMSPGSLNPASWFSLPPPALHAKPPSLTSSLFGIARGVWTGVGVQATGSMEAERRKQWERTVREVPVLETLKSVLGVGLELKPTVEQTESGLISSDYMYSLPIPATLPPSFRGRALKISYSLVIGIEIEYSLPALRPGFDNPNAFRRKKTLSQVIKVPLRVWGGVDSLARKDGYDLMKPVIQRKEEASLQKLEPTLVGKGNRTSSKKRKERKEEADFNPAPSTESSFRSYVAHLLSTIPLQEPELPPLPPDAPPPNPQLGPDAMTPKHKHTRSQALSPTTHSIMLPKLQINGETSTEVDSVDNEPGANRKKSRALLETSRSDEDEIQCEEILEGLLRSSRKASYDIEKDGQIVAVFTLVKSAFRLGETVQGVVEFNEPNATRKVLKFSAQLQAHEIIPSSLHPPHSSSLQSLIRTHADFHNSLTIHTSRLPFSLDIPSPGTAGGSSVSPSFVLRAEPESAETPRRFSSSRSSSHTGINNGATSGGTNRTGQTPRSHPGGLEWKIKLSFLVSVPMKARQGQDPSTISLPSHLLPMVPDPQYQEFDDPRHHAFLPGPSIAPVVSMPASPSSSSATASVGKAQDEGVVWAEMRTEVVECDVPIVVYPPSRLGIGVTGAGGGMGRGDGSERKGGVVYVVC